MLMRSACHNTYLPAFFPDRFRVAQMQKTNEIVKRKQKAYLLLDQINPESAAILVDFYFNKKTIIASSRSIHLERRQTYRRLNEALAELQIVLDSSELQAHCHRSA